ncbi:MAG: site-2 protease family protein [Dehalococcoidales bacterium]|nr:site-2 protease family protein [Dehalococcoidales bacterium]
MNRNGIYLGKAFGIPIRLHYSWFIIFILVSWALIGNYFPAVYPFWSLTSRIAAGIITSLLFFASVLVHELMHSIVSQRQGIPVHSITLFVFGGVSQITEEPSKPQDEFRMAVAGPLSSLVLSGILFGIYYGFGNTANFAAQFVRAITYWLGYINLVLGIFNLVPGFPLDGGRVLRSIIWWQRRDLRSATKIASAIGRIIGFLFIFGGIWLAFSGQWFSGIWLALIGWFLESAAQGSYQQVILRGILKGHRASEVMSRDCVMIPPETTIDRLVYENILTSGRRCFPVIAGNKVIGLMTLSDVRAIPRDRWATATVREAMTPLERLKWVRPEEELSRAFQLMAENDINQIPVLEDSQIVGMITRENLLNFVNIRTGLGI